MPIESEHLSFLISEYRKGKESFEIFVSLNLQFNADYSLQEVLQTIQDLDFTPLIPEIENLLNHLLSNTSKSLKSISEDLQIQIPYLRFYMAEYWERWRIFADDGKKDFIRKNKLNFKRRKREFN
jgi:hypothetical protein